MSEAIVVLVTCPPSKSKGLARTLVGERLAACVNIVPSVGSAYRWKGKVKFEWEALLVIKARRDAFERLRARVVELHPYDVPEIIALPIEAGHGPYLQWLMSEKD